MEEITKGLKENKLIIGTKQTIKKLRKDGLAKVFLASNCPELIVEDIEYYCSLADIPVKKMAANCAELGVICKKPFLVSVVSITK